jgi:hypothetical protein
MAGVALVFAVGAWLITAPFALRYQPSGAAWTGATRIDVITGATLVVAGFGGVFGVIAGRVRELYADARSAASLASAADRVSAADSHSADSHAADRENSAL